MELKVFRDTLSAAGSCCTAKAEIPIETEILISDYLPQVFKIVKCFAHPVILQKQLQSGRLTLEGYLRCTVFYQGENGAGLCQIEQKLPFSKIVELPPFEFSAWTATVGGETEYLNCRAVNQHRIEVRGAFGLVASVHTQLKTEVITALADGGMETLPRTLHGVRNAAVLDKLITADATINFEQPPAAVLDISGTATLRELKLLNGKAAVKGEIRAVYVWRAEGQEELRSSEVLIPFNQISDVDGLTEDSRCLCVAEPVGFTLAQGENNAPAQLTATALLHLRAWRSYEINCVTDAFSTKYETQNTVQELATENIVCMLDERTRLTASGPLPDENTKLLACFAAFDAPQIAPRNDVPCLIAHGVVTAFGQNSLGEIESYDKPVELALELKVGAETDCESLYPECWLSDDAITCTCAGGTLEATINIHVEGAVLRRESVPCVQNVETTEPLAQADPDIALRIYYAQAGEELFAVAKHFHVSPQEMRKANELEDNVEALPAARRLLVPEC